MKKFFLIVVSAATLIVGSPGWAMAQSVDENGDGVYCVKEVDGGRVHQRDNNVGTSTGCPRGFTPISERELGCSGAKACKLLKKECLKAAGTYTETTSSDGTIKGECTL